VSRSNPDPHPRGPIGAARIAWVDKPVGTPYGPFVAGLRAAVEPRGALWQLRLSLGPAREFWLWLPEDGASPGADPAAELPAGSLVVRGMVVASAVA